METKHLHSTRFLPTGLAALVLAVLAGCASSPEVAEEQPAAEENVVLLPPAAPVQREPQPAEQSQAVELKPDYPRRYEVVKGDTLWDISARFLKDPWMWPKLWHFNTHIANPHLIYPGDVLSIVFIDGKPTMQVSRGEKRVAPPKPLPPKVTESGQRYPTVKLSPRVRELGLDEAIPTLSINVIGPFLSRPQVLGEGELEMAPYIMEQADDRLLSGSGAKVYARGFDEENLHDSYLIVRAGEVYRNPEDSEDILGYEATYLGEARLTRLGDPMTLKVTDSVREIMRGDRLIPKGNELIQHSYSPRAPEHKVEGQIISVLDGVSMIGPYQVVVLDLGRQDDMAPGHVLAVNQRGADINDSVVKDERVTLPTERAGTLMIFRVFDRVSYALVMDATQTIRLLDQVANP